MKRWEEIYQVALPLPFSLRIIHAYVIAGQNGLTVLDTGLNRKETEQVWQQFLAENDFTWSDIEKIVITHYHPDHYGFAGEMQNRSGAPVYISEVDYQQAQLFWGSASTMAAHMAEYFQKNGLEESFVRQIPKHLKSFVPWVTPHPEVIFLKEGESISLGDRTYEIIHTPGHADGHLSFLDPERRWLLVGDALLPRITPNISLWPNCDPNPLNLFLHTLEKMKTIPVEKAFPAHGDVFTNYRERILQLEEHHQKRLDLMRDFLTDQGEGNAKEVCDFAFGKDLSIHNLRFALSETLAHLEYIVAAGGLKRREDGGTFRYYRD